MSDQPNLSRTSTDRSPVAARVTAGALAVVALALSVLAASAVYNTWFAADLTVSEVELAGPVTVEPDLEVLKAVAEPLLVYQCLQTRAGQIDGEFLAECNEEAQVVLGLLDGLAEPASRP